MSKFVLAKTCCFVASVKKIQLLPLRRSLQMGGTEATASGKRRSAKDKNASLKLLKAPLSRFQQAEPRLPWPTLAMMLAAAGCMKWKCVSGAELPDLDKWNVPSITRVLPACTKVSLFRLHVLLLLLSSSISATKKLHERRIFHPGSIP